MTFTCARRCALALTMLSGMLLGGRPFAPAVSAQSDLPTGRQIADKFLAAIGGAAAFKSVASMRATGTFSLPAQSIEGPIEMLSARPDKSLLRIELTGIGHIETGYDGKVGWMIDPQSGPALLSGQELGEMVEDAWFDGPLHSADHVTELATVERDTFDQRVAYKVRVTFKSGEQQFEYYDVTSGFWIGWEGKRMTPMGDLPSEAYLREYKACGPIKEPTVLVQKALGAEQRITIDTCQTNTVMPDAFALPPAIKALIK